VVLTGSLRVPGTIAAWLDEFWHDNGLVPPAIDAAVDGGSVGRVSPDEVATLGARDGVQVIASERTARRHDGWLHPLDALGLEWPEVVLVEPETILREHGEAGLFVAATRAIDALHVAAAG